MNQAILDKATDKSPLQFSPDQSSLLKLYEQMLTIRKFELAVQENYRKGEIPGFIHLCVGQEAVAVGICSQLKKTDWITSTHRGHGHALAKGVDVKVLMAELYGKKTGTNGGRGGSMHIYSSSDGVFGTNGLVGGGIPHAVGIGISAQVQGKDSVAVAFFGDGAICHGSFHESISLAAIKKSPVIFVCENNLYATCTPISFANINTDIAGRASAYGIKGFTVDGNDILAISKVVADALAFARNGSGPVLIEALTYRTVGHHEGDVLIGTYRTQEELDRWKQRDPIKLFEDHLKSEVGVLEDEISSIGTRVDKKIEEALAFARTSERPDPSSVSQNCWADPVNPAIALDYKASEEAVTQTWLVAVRDGIAEEMRVDGNIVYMGEGIGERGGTFGHTKNLWQEFGEKRVIDTPICELAFTGAAAAASATGCRTIADLMFADFIFDAATQIINQASKLRYMSNGQLNVPMIIRAGAGQIKQAGPQHSGTFHSIWAHCPGLIVAVPSTPADAKGLMKTALRSGDPVIFLEPKSLLSSKGPVPVNEHFVPFGKARLVEQGTDITIVSFGQPVHNCTEAARVLNKDGISCEVIDLRTIMPLDKNSIIQSVSKTKHLLVVDEGYAPCSIGGEISALVTEALFYELKAPVGRLNKISVPQPFSPTLEDEISITPVKIMSAVRSVLNGTFVTPDINCHSGIKSAADLRSAMSVSVEGNEEVVKKVESGSNRQNNVEVVIPNLGLTITEVTITKWYKKTGDTVKKGESLLDFESEKSVIELEAPSDGTLGEIVALENSTLPIGALVCYLEV